MRRWSTSGTCNKSVVGSPTTQELTTGRLHPRRIASRVASVSQALPSRSGLSVSPGSKRPPSPGYDPVQPRKKARTMTTSRKKEARRFTVASPKEMDVDCSDVSAVDRSNQIVSGAVSADERGALNWRFVYGHEKSSRGQEHMDSIPSNTLTPRVWTNSLGGLLTVFPELAKSAIDFSWFQSETPILLLDTNYARGDWTNSTTLNVDLLWDFSCYDSELEPIQSDAEDSARLRSSDPVVHSAENTLDYLSSEIGLSPTYVTVSAPTFSTPLLASNGIPLDEPVHMAVQNDPASTARSAQPCPSDLPCPPENVPPSYPYLALNGSLTPDTTSPPAFQPRIPLNKPPDVETLLNSHHHSIPLLLWVSHDSGLVPCNLPPEYAYSCMGLFFISDLRHAVIRHDVSPTTGLVQGRVCWSLTLHDTTKDIPHPWWSDPTDTPSQTDKATLYRPRDLTLQFFSFIPLDFLAEFHPSESFPRGWFCKSCGMINIQVFFRHQICQSTRCRSTRDKRIPPGKVDPLSSLRDPHQSSTLIRPTNDIPSVVVPDSVAWDDGMQSWIYSVKNGVTLCHVFTGNQEHLQEDATALLEKIQCEVLLRKEDFSSPYFTHSTRLSHPNDRLEALVPAGTPDCVRIAYYTLCDFVHRYGEMEVDKPRFCEVRMQAWANTGSKKGNVLRASKSPVVVHCLGAEVVLNITPKGGYGDTAESTGLDKGKGRARDEDRVGSPPTESLAGPSHHPQQDNGNQTPLIPGPEANKTPIVAENADEAAAAMDTMRQCCSHDTGGIAILGSRTCPEMEVANCEVAARRARKHKGAKDKNKASVPEISMTLVHGDCVVLCGDDFEYQIVRTGTTICQFARFCSFIL
ncbi:hypothetical protein EV363DRAFT_1391802 [Boletus edulis]|nr:hypothetical protein EV363DRAFT_1391802 [Boletus edulis]